MPRLTLKRREGEVLRLTVAGHVIRVTVAETHSGCVRLTVEAPAEVAIRREELGEPDNERKTP